MFVMSEDGTKREEIKEENHELEDDEQDELEDGRMMTTLRRRRNRTLLYGRQMNEFYGSYYVHTRLFIELENSKS